MTTSRSERLAEAIKTDVSEIIQRDLRDPRIGFVSITEVVVSHDLRHAKIFVSVLGDDEA
jgi:ribosome-binding factor A